MEYLHIYQPIQRIMKKSSLLIFTILIIPISLFVLFNKSNSESVIPKAGYNYIPCTPAKFLLSEVDTTKQIAPLFDNLGTMEFPVSTKNAEAQAFFNQGMKLTYAFNHAEAHRAFMEAARLDPNSAMAYWGQAYALGPNINDGLPDDERKAKANEALAKAMKLSGSGSAMEQALITALQSRYSEDLSTDIAELNMAYMKAMEKVQTAYPNNDHVQTLFAASVMNTTPWNYWNEDGTPGPNVAEAKSALEKALEINPDNPGAHHYYIHMVELPYPDLGVPSADALAALMPGAGHLVHMPSHIYMRVGRYLDAVESNQAAILADEDYISQCYTQGLYPLGYYPHNIHFLWSAASMLGDSEVAIDAAKKTAEKVPVGEFVEMPFLQDFASTPMLAYVRFGKWNEILTIPGPNAELKHLALIRHYARGMAFIRKGNVTEAREELEALLTLKNDPTLKDLMATAENTSDRTANIAYAVVAGELAALEGDLPKAIEHLKQAVVHEDNLTYMEPAGWYIPTRQNLGAVYMQAKKYAEAEAIYKEDLAKMRQNGWSLIGLYNALVAQGKTTEAQKIKQEFDTAWRHADFEIDSSVL